MRKEVIITENKGVYIHLPFCAAKCAYCDFYSTPSDENTKDAYLSALIREIEKHRGFSPDTLYLGGGTPTLFGDERLSELIKKAKEIFGEFSEITVEANPADGLLDTFKTLKSIGVNRISLGVQSGIDSELRILSRRHNTEDVRRTVSNLRQAGLDNFSLDLMLGIPDQTAESLKKSLDFLVSLEPRHISAYILKIEENTPFFEKKDTLNIPDGDTVAEFYLYTVDYLEKAGYHQYEISNFAESGFESKHNLIYWNGGEYLGIGAAAHGFFGGKRYYYPRSIPDFINGNPPIPDGEGGTLFEKIMLSLRLTSGLDLEKAEAQFGKLPDGFFEKSRRYRSIGLAEFDEKHLSLTPKGMLVSNAIISDLLSEI